MNKFIHREPKKEPKKRAVAEKWTFSDDFFEYNRQIQLINDILNETITNETEEGVKKIIIQQINKKISGYKQQDIIKKKLDNNKFITFISIIEKMIECELKCRYCKESMNILYDISREMKQWSVDRINNEFGHNLDNFHLACLDCNLKRRRRTDRAFLFTKQLIIIKEE
jgi:hypothetical protein